MTTKIGFDSFHGTRDEYGFITGFDYSAQMWVATDPTTPRDSTCKPGSANNPLPHLRDLPKRVKS